jgi:ATP-dependent DNA ligase
MDSGQPSETDTRNRGLPLPVTTAPMEAHAADALPEGPGWQFEPKWDGFRCLAFRSGTEIDLRSKSGRPLARYFPDVVSILGALPAERFVLDGELVIPAGGELSFEALQLRLHPADSRVRKLAGETPAEFILFDLLFDPEGNSLMDRPLRERRAALEHFVSALPDTSGLRLSPSTHNRGVAERWLRGTGTALDGVVAKRCDDPYLPDERAFAKVKRLRTADCVVGGFRYAQGKKEVGSLLLGLYDADGKLDHVGFTSGFADMDRAALTARLEALVEPPGFTGRSPGGPSRWSTERTGEYQPLRHELVAEVRYDHVTGDRFRHGTKFLRWRPDKAAVQCRMDQLDAPADPDRLATLLGSRDHG